MPWRKMCRHNQKRDSINNTWRLGGVADGCMMGSLQMLQVQVYLQRFKPIGATRKCANTLTP